MNKEEYIVFSMEILQYAFPLHYVVEVLRVPKITSVPGSASNIEGVINVRGTIIPVVNVSTQLHVQNQTKNRIIIVEHDQQQIGVIVEDIHNVTYLEPVLVDEAQCLHIEKDICVGFGRTNEQVVGILDVQKVL